ncbi:MAG TPA: ABC transporter ATP-binding protein [Salinivirgaceae bacterium]|nr:ABC transporter ATP-binding protein [Salinivirgaceae bacterium]
MSSEDLVLKLENVTIGYEDSIILRDVHFEVYRQDFIGVIGPNGGGKTTLLKAIVGLIPIEKGKIFLHGNKPPGYLPQISNHDRWFPISAVDVVLSGMWPNKGFFKRYSKKDREHAMEWLRFAQIEHLAQKNFGDLSGGQRQRVLLCRALISNPNLLLLDEPNTFVDNNFERDLYELLLKLNETMAIIMVSHDLGTISSYVKSIACVNRNLHHHKSNIITNEQLESYNCPIQLISHGMVPHTVLPKH